MPQPVRHAAEGAGPEARRPRRMTQERAPELRQFAGIARRPGQTCGAQAPADVGQFPLLTPEALTARESPQQPGLVPRQRDAALRQVHDPGGFLPPQGPFDLQLPSQTIVRPARLKAPGQRGAGIEAIALVGEGAGAAADVDVRFQHAHPTSGARQQGARRQAADSAADDQHTGLAQVAASSARRVRQWRYMKSRRSAGPSKTRRVNIPRQPGLCASVMRSVRATPDASSSNMC